MYKKVNVVTLPTNEKANIILDKGILEYIEKSQIASTINSIVKGFNLYFLSDEEIKKGDWCIMLDDFENVFSNPQQYTDPNTQHLNKGLRKIIATTDKSLYINISRPLGVTKELPKPSASFMSKYIEEYNKGNVITEVMVEYDCDHNQMPAKIIDVLKINSDNTINIKRIKNSWNREEVIILLKVFERDIIHNKVILDEWIEENI